MNRHAADKIVLHDGKVIPKGANITFPIEPCRDDTYFENGSTFDGYRFLRLRSEPDQENRWQFATTSKEHLAFGHGVHSCPGRFFASNEIKLMLCHLILKYDWRFIDGKRPPNVRPHAAIRVLDSKAEIEYKSRTSEIAFEALTYQTASTM